VVLDMICMTEQDARELVSTCRNAVDRVVVLSSMDVYWNYGAFTRIESGDPIAGPMTEASPLRTVLYPYRSLSKSEDDLTYNYEKILVERVVMNDPELQATVLRLPAVYGPGDHRCFDYLKRMIDGRPMILLGKTVSSWRWSRGYVDDIAEAIALAVTDARATDRVYNVGEADALSESEWVRAIARGTGWKGELVIVPDEALPQHLRMPYDFRHHLWGDTTRFRNEFGFTERFSRPEAIKITVDWERTNSPADFDSSRFNYAAEDAAIAALTS
jgi:nucleoside-diphosphate-sugar epimerase